MINSILIPMKLQKHYVLETKINSVPENWLYVFKKKFKLALKIFFSSKILVVNSSSFELEAI